MPTTKTVKVPWVVGRQRYLAHAIAVFIAETQGAEWFEMPQGARDALVEKCHQRVIRWCNNDVLAVFMHDYAEKGTP